MTQPIQRISRTDKNFPSYIQAYLKNDTPETIWARGNIELLPNGTNNAKKEDLWAIFCSNKCPGEIILNAHDLAHHFRNNGVSTVGGFHSPIEKECLRVLLRGSQPIINCPARSIETMRIKPEWKEPIFQDRFCILSIFHKEPRQNATRARKRNHFVAALASKILIAHAAEGSKTLEFAQTLLKWGKPVYTFDSSYNKPLLQLGTQLYQFGNSLRCKQL